MSFARPVKTPLEAATRSAPARFLDNIRSGFAWLGRKPRAPYRNIIRLRSAGLPLGAVIALAILIPFVLVADARRVTNEFFWLVDGPAILAARGLPGSLVGAFNDITDFGKSGWLLWPLGLALLGIAAAVAGRALDRPARLVLATIAVRLEFLFLAIALPGLFSTTVKRLIGRARPFVGGEADPSLYAPLGWNVEYASLPSGHATTAFAALVAFGAVWPPLRPVLWIYAIAIALSRVIITAHHPTDVLAGALVGSLGALLIRNAFAMRGLVFTVDPAGAVRAKPGPRWPRVKSVARAVFRS